MSTELCGAAMPDYEDEKRDGPFLCTYPKGHPVPMSAIVDATEPDPIEFDHGNIKRGGFWSITKVRHEPGTLFLDPATGNAYRLRDYSTDWLSDDLADTKPNYSVAYAKGGFNTAHELPEGCTIVWTPPKEKS